VQPASPLPRRVDPEGPLPKVDLSLEVVVNRDRPDLNVCHDVPAYGPPITLIAPGFLRLTRVLAFGTGRKENGPMADEHHHDDLVELGGRQVLPSGRQLIPPGWRSSRGAGVLAATTLVVGLAAGYAAGDRHVSRASAVPGPAVTVTKTATPQPTPVPGTFSFAGSVLAQVPGGCSVQLGHKLQLGVQVANMTTDTVTLQTVKAALPMGGLKQVSQTWTTCGSLLDPLTQGPATLAAGASAWLTVTFQVQDTCPAPYPVQFKVRYLAGGHTATASLPGFADLGGVPYSGCPHAGATP
jgi:hypothetical protein